MSNRIIDDSVNVVHTSALNVVLQISKSQMGMHGPHVYQVQQYPSHPQEGVVTSDGFEYASVSSYSLSAYKHRSARTLGALQICVGMSIFGLNVLAIIINASVMLISAGIWGGALFIITGSIGVVSSKTKTRCMILSFMILSITSAIISIAPLVMAATGIFVDVGNSRELVDLDYDDNIVVTEDIAFDNKSVHDYHTFIYATDSAIIALSVTEAILAIISAGLCCAVICCGLPSMGHALSVHDILSRGSQILIIPNESTQASTQDIVYTIQNHSNKQDNQSTAQKIEFANRAGSRRGLVDFPPPPPRDQINAYDDAAPPRYCSSNDLFMEKTFL